jgi:putative DNA primase/helicase
VKAKKHVCGANCISPGKHPCTPNGFKAATVSEATIRAWWQRWPEAGIGIPTGKASGWLVVDIDPRHGGDASLTALTEQHGPIGEALEQATGGGGDHLAFDYNALPAGVEIGNSAGKLGPGLDVRGEGGYIVAAPTLHVSGRRYGWRNAIAPPPMPAWMIERLLAKDPPRVNEDYAPRPQRTGVFGAVIPDGQRNNGLFKVACGIWGKGQASDQIDLHAQLLEVNARRCSPPLDDGEVAMMAAHVGCDYPRGTPITSVDADKGAAAYSAAREVFEL